MILNIIEEIMIVKNINYIRIDGDTPIEERDSICQEFNRN